MLAIRGVIIATIGDTVRGDFDGVVVSQVASVRSAGCLEIGIQPVVQTDAANLGI